MVLEPVLKQTVMAVTRALKGFAASQGWGPEDYQILFHLYSDWGNVQVMFVVKDFADLTKQQMWDRVNELMRSTLGTIPERRFVVGLIIRSQDEVAQGGIYRIHEDYIDHRDLLLEPVSAD